MKTLKDYEIQLKGNKKKGEQFYHCCDRDGVLELIDEAAKDSFARGFCAGSVNRPNITIDQMSVELKERWGLLKEWFDKEFTNGTPNSPDINATKQSDKETK